MDATRPLALVRDTPQFKIVDGAPHLIPPAAAPPGEQWLYTAVSHLLTTVGRLEGRIAELEGRPAR